MKRLLVSLGLLFFVAEAVYAVPDTTLSITPTPTSGTTITASDETSRMNAITSAYNSHSHTDLTKTTQNTFTIGNSASGSKSLAIANQFTTAPSVRYSDTRERWQFSNNASTFIDLTRLESTAVSFTRTAAQGAGSVSITGVGFTPTSVWAMCVDNTAGTRASVGFSDSARTAMQIINIASNFSRSTAQFIDIENGADTMFVSSIASYDADGFTFSWSKTGAGLQANCVAIAYR